MKRGGTLGLLATLYFVQGLPYGFQENALPAFLTRLGVSLTAVGFASALSWPWALKPLWAPLIDRYGTRRRWIIPLQLLLALACVAAAWSEPSQSLGRLILIVLVMNVLTATQDIAVDGLAVDRLGKGELGFGNSAQVVGYKLGMLVGGGLLFGFYAPLGWQGIFYAMAGCCLLGMVVLALSAPEARSTLVEHQQPSWRELAARVRAALSAPGHGSLLVLVATYKMGEAVANKMFGPYLVKQGVEPETVAAWMGTWVMVASLLGSLFGGVLCTRMRPMAALGWAGAFRVLGLLGQWLLVQGLVPVEERWVVLLSSVEHFFAGALTVCMFALMMSRVDKRIGATHFTVLAAIEVWGKALPALASGALVDAVGFPLTFLLAVLLSLVFVVVLRWTREGQSLGRAEGH